MGQMEDLAAHEWVECWQEYEAVLVCTNDLKSRTPEEAMRAFGIYQFLDAATKGDAGALLHSEYGTVVRYDGGVLAIDCGHESLSDALSDLFQALYQLGWRGAEVYHPAATMNALLADMGGAIPANLDFDVRPAGMVIPMADSAPGQLFVEGMHRLRGGATTPGVATMDSESNSAKVLQGIRALGSERSDSFTLSEPGGFGGALHLIDDDAVPDEGDLVTLNFGRGNQPATPANVVDLGSDDYPEPGVFKIDTLDDAASGIAQDDSQINYSALAANLKTEATQNGLMRMPGEPDIETGVGRALPTASPVIREDLPSATGSEGGLVELFAASAPLPAAPVPVADEVGAVLARNVELLSDVERLSADARSLSATNEELRLLVERLTSASEGDRQARAHAEHSLNAALLARDEAVRKVEAMSADGIGELPVGEGSPKVVRVGRSAFCFDLPGNEIDRDELVTVGAECAVSSEKWIHVRPGAVREQVRWDVLGEVDESFPWSAERLAEVLVPGTDCRLLAGVMLALKSAMPFAGLRDVLEFGLHREIASEGSKALLSTVSPAAVHLLRSADAWSEVEDTLFPLALAPVGAAFVDLLVDGELASDLQEVFTVREVLLSPTPRMFVLHVDALDSPFVLALVESLRRWALLLASAGRFCPVVEAEVPCVVVDDSAGESVDAKVVESGNAGVAEVTAMLGTVLKQLEKLQFGK